MGEADYWRGVALEAQGKQGEAAEAYLAAYTAADNRLSLAALHRLHEIYRTSSGKNADDWRERWRASSAGTVFDPAYLPSGGSSGGYSVQLGAFSSRDHAAELVGRVRRMGLFPDVVEPSEDKLYRVRISGIADQNRLIEITSVLERNKLDYHVIKPGN